MTDNFVKIRPAIMAMAVGETIEFPIAKLKSVRTQASEIGAITERRYTTRTNREARTISITRVGKHYDVPSVYRQSCALRHVSK